MADLRLSFEKIADVSGGRVTGNPLPQIVTTINGFRCVMSLQEVAPMEASDPFESVPARSRFYTRFSIFVPRSFRKRLELYPQRPDMDIKFLKMVDIQIGVPEFDPRYVIKSNDPEFARKFLTQEVRSTIDILRKTNQKDEVFVSMNRDRLNIAIAGVYRSHETNKLFFDMCVKVFDDLVAYCESNAGLKVMEVATGTGACPVCGEALNDKTVLCRNCGTPHHKACWDFNKKCAIFGCGSVSSNEGTD